MSEILKEWLSAIAVLVALPLMLGVVLLVLITHPIILLIEKVKGDAEDEDEAML